MREPDEPFYVGYLDAPPDTRRRMRRVAMTLAAGAVLVGAALALATGPFAPSLFEFATEREFVGTVETAPVPVLVAAGGERIPLVAPGKHGALPLTAGWDGTRVKLRGKRIARAGRTMVEVAPGSIGAAPPGAPEPATRVVDLGPVELRGEIVDSKCFLGVMNPGELEVHRACAIRCISGGIPPMLHVRDERGREAQVLLVSSTGKPVNREILDLVARPVRVRGRLEQRDDLFYLYADPASFALVSR